MVAHDVRMLRRWEIGSTHDDKKPLEKNLEHVMQEFKINSVWNRSQRAKSSAVVAFVWECSQDVGNIKVCSRLTTLQTRWKSAINGLAHLSLRSDFHLSKANIYYSTMMSTDRSNNLGYCAQIKETRDDEMPIVGFTRLFIFPYQSNPQSTPLEL